MDEQMVCAQFWSGSAVNLVVRETTERHIWIGQVDIDILPTL
jgi:hypothetical protein